MRAALLGGRASRAGRLPRAHRAAHGLGLADGPGARGHLPHAPGSHAGAGADLVQLLPVQRPPGSRGGRLLGAQSGGGEALGAARRARRAPGGGACESNENWRTLAGEVLRSLLHFPSARTFWRPVDDGEAEAYARVVTKPMDLGRVQDRLGREGYATPESLLADAALVWSNAQLYHGRAHPVSRDAAAARDEFARLWTAAGLPLDSKKRAWGGGAHDDGRWQRLKVR